MRLVIHTNDGIKEHMIGEGYDCYTWYWSGTVPDGATGTGNLIIKWRCHPGCRIEIPRERIIALEIYTNDHMNSTQNEASQS